jgi:hypothetical protein
MESLNVSRLPEILQKWVTTFTISSVSLGFRVWSDPKDNSASQPIPEQWIDLPDRFAEHSIISFEKFDDYLLCGTNKGTILLYDLSNLSLVRTYSSARQEEVLQLYANIKNYFFYAVKTTSIIEYGTQEDGINTSLANPTPIALSCLNRSIYFADVAGRFYSFSCDNTSSDFVKNFITADFEGVDHFESLLSNNGYPNCFLITIKNFVAIVNVKSKGFDVLARELLMVEQTKMATCIYGPDFFYSPIRDNRQDGSSIVSARKLMDIGIPGTKEDKVSIPYAAVKEMNVFGKYLVVITNKPSVELIKATTFTRTYRIDFPRLPASRLVNRIITKTYMIGLTLFAATNVSDIFVKKIPYSSQICYKCKDKYIDEIRGLKIVCCDNLPQFNDDSD